MNAFERFVHCLKQFEGDGEMTFGEGRMSVHRAENDSSIFTMIGAAHGGTGITSHLNRAQSIAVAKAILPLDMVVTRRGEEA